jgi:ABC-type bacteriocin/lantibiotic exporter with double-glycine peptidase domain
MRLAGATLPTTKSHVVFVCGEWACDLDEVILAADLRGEILPLWRAWRTTIPTLDCAIASGREPQESVLRRLSDEFRYRRSLTAAEECEEWLAQRSLKPVDLRDHFVRTYWASSGAADQPKELESSSEAWRRHLAWFRADLLLSEDFDCIARQLAWRMAASKAARESVSRHTGRAGKRSPSEGRDPGQAVSLAWAADPEAGTVFQLDPVWAEQLQLLEEAYEAQRASVLTARNRERMLHSLRLGLLRVELEVLEFQTEKAARQALLCFREEGLTFAQGAHAAGAEIQRTSSLLEDLPEDWRQPLLSAAEGTISSPLMRGDRFNVCRLLAKDEPRLESIEVRRRVEDALLRQHLMELEGRHVHWQIDIELSAASLQETAESKTGAQSFYQPLAGDPSGKELTDNPDTPFILDGIKPTERGRIWQFPFIWQIDEMDCGVASLAMVCRHFGRDVSVARLRRLCYTGGDGTSLKDICAAATEVGLAARPLKISKRHLDYAPLPAIVHWEGNHWLVLIAVAEDSVKVADPAFGIRTLPRSEFLDKWTGYTALFDYTEGFEPVPERHRSLAWLRLFLAPFRASLLQSLGLAALVSVLQLLFPILTQQVVDTVMVDRNLGLLKVLLLVMAIAVSFLLLANLTQQYLLSYITLRLDTSVLDFLTRRLLALPMSYFQRRRTGDIQRRLDAARQIRQFMVQSGIGGLLSLVQLIGCLTLMCFYSPLLLGVFLLVIPLYGGLMLFSAKVLRPLFAEIEETQARYQSHQIDAIRGIEAVKSAAAEWTFRDKMLREFLAVSHKVFRSNFIMMSYEGMLQAVGFVATALFLFAGARLVISGSLSIGAFVAFSSLMAMASAAILHTLGLWDELQLMSVLVNRLQDLFEQEPEQGADRSRLIPVRSLSGKIELRDVSFRYGGVDSPEVVRNVSVDIPAGHTVAIVGRSGCGKTTLVKLLAGLMEPTSGSILYDGQELKTLNYRELRQHIGIVLQENHLFDDTILNNIAFGDLVPDPDRAVRAAMMANAQEFIDRLPLGYETRIGETGLGLSSGQRQRVAIARALYNDPPVLIFDEATSALDSESERAVQSNMSRLLSNRTSVVIAHRMSTIRDADQILVLERGEVVERGTHKELIELRGLYYHLCSEQLAV